MWGNFLEKAKGLAENLDKQLNESVGLDADPNAPSTSTTSIATPSIFSPSGVPSLEPIQDTPNGNDAWNDNFDFDDDVNEGTAPPEEDDPRLEIQAEKDHVASEPLTPASPSQFSDSPPDQPFSPIIDPALAPTSFESTLQISRNDDELHCSPAPQTEQADEEPNGSAWDGGEDIIDLDADGDDNDAENANTENQGKIASENVPITWATEDNSGSEAMLTDTEEIPTVEEVDIAPIIVRTSDPVASTPISSSPILSSVGMEPIVKTDEVPESSSKKGIAFGNMFSSLAHTAEALAHQAESLVQIPHQERTSTSAVTSIFSTFPLTSSSAPSDKPEPANEDMDNGMFDTSESGWAEETGNLDLDDFEAADQDKLSIVMSPDSNTIGGEDRMVDANIISRQPDAETQPPVPSSPPQVSQPPSTGTLTPVLNVEADPRYQQLLEQLRLRENQLSNKSNQLTELQQMMDQQEKELRQKLAETKEEAKKRILSAKERCEAAEAKVQQLQSLQSADSASQAQLIQALREEGGKLAHKQSTMEQAVRAAKTESRNYKEQLETEEEAKNIGLEKIAKLEAELKSTKELLSAARKGESQASKLEQDLMAVRSDSEMKASTILSLQQQVKELVAESKDMQELLERARKEAQKEVQLETKTLRREHNDVISDLEAKLRTTEREAGVREDALRHEVSELRKRWEDAVRRADALSVDVQSSTAPLLRQLESMDRQNRVRAANWTELENRLRSELEENVIQNETLTKERSEFKTKCSRLERLVSDYEQDLKQCKRTVEEQTTKISKLETQLEEMEVKAAKREEDYSKVERLANEGVMRVRSEMTQTVVDSEERYRGQINKLENELREERDRKSQLEKQVEQLLENAGMIMMPATEMIRREAKPKRLRQAEGQAQILAGALGFDSDTDDDDNEAGLGSPMERGEGNGTSGSSLNSFAALDQLTSKLKANTVELESLKRNLRESERVRESLVEELSESRVAKEKLPLFEAKVKELTQENREMELEIQGLREDIADVREMYRAQLNILLEDKARQQAPAANDEQGDPTNTPTVSS